MAAGSPGAHDVRRLIVLGSTGSIGTQTLDVVAHLNALHERGEWPTRFEVVGLAAGRNIELLTEQAQRFGVRDVAANCSRSEPAAGTRRYDDGRTWRHGPEAAERLVREIECDVVLGAIVGSAGLQATLAAVELGRDVALANKEALVTAGGLVVPLAQRTGSRLLPVDSEHSALWQCLRGADGERTCPPCRIGPELRRIVLTASGGPFRTWDRARIERATTAEALAHPTWSMGPKVTIDSASLTNKAFEVIEAHWLFGLEGERIDVLIHPQSLVHSMVEFADGSVIAQLGAADMRGPIQHALTYPHRAPRCGAALDWRALSRLDFEPPDTARFPALGLAYRVIEAGGTAGAVFNGASEAATRAFLDGAIPFGRIAELVAGAVERIGASPVNSLADVLAADDAARRFVAERIGTR